MRKKVTFDVDPELYRSIRLAALETNTTIKIVVATALREWLERYQKGSGK